MTTNLLFFTALSFLLTHEMDAVRRHEWRVLFAFAKLTNDAHGYMLFTALHVPLYVLIFWQLFAAGGAGINQSAVIVLDSFCVLHVGLHLLFRNHPAYEFNNWFSWTLILGAGIAGAVDLMFRI